MVFKLPAGLKGYEVTYNRLSEIIGIEVGFGNNTIFMPHIRLAVSKPILCASSGVTSPV